MSSECVGGVVVRVKGPRAYVRLVRSRECNGCRACMLANMKNELVLPAKNDIGASVGDEVRILGPKQKPLHTWLILFILPLTLMLLGIATGYLLTLSELNIFACAVIGLFVGLVVIFILDRLLFSDKYLARVLEIINNQGEKHDD